METAILAFGTIGFWLFIAASAIAMLTFINFQKGAAATVVAVLTVLGFQYYGGIDIFGHVKSHPMALLAYGGVYALCGMATGVFKWWRFVRNNRAKYIEAKAEFVADGKSLADWPRYRDAGDYHAIKFTFEPAARQHKAAITMWMTYWPLVLVWTVINDPVRKFFRMMYDSVTGLLERISKNAFKDVDDDLPAKSRRTVNALDE